MNHSFLLQISLLIGLVIHLPASAQATDEPTVLRFSEIFVQPIGPFGLQFTDHAQSLNGKRIRISGYMVQQEYGSLPGQFLMAFRPIKMSEHSDGDADDLPPSTLLVRLAPHQAEWHLPYINKLIELVGVLSLGRDESRQGRVNWLRLELDESATREMTPTEMTIYLLSRFHHH